MGPYCPDLSHVVNLYVMMSVPERNEKDRKTLHSISITPDDVKSDSTPKSRLGRLTSCLHCLRDGNSLLSKPAINFST